MQTLGKVLKQMRENAGLSQREVATSLRYGTSQFISNWERDISHPPIDCLRKLSKIYGIDAEYLYTLISDDILKREALKLSKRWRACK